MTLKAYSFSFTEGEKLVFRKREDLSVSQWAEKYRVVVGKPLPGPWRNDLAPFLIEPMDTYGLPHVREIILCFAPQVGKTNIALNCLLASIDQDPGPCMYVMPDEKVAKRIARRRIIPTFRATPRISALLSDRIGETTTLAVRFRNGADLMMTWATSAAELASEPVQHLVLDETDKYPDFTGKEADPSSLAEVRTNAFPFTKKIIKLSTPGPEPSTIMKALITEADEIRCYHARCPICGTIQFMDFDQIVWPKNVRDPREIERKKLARYQCVDCGMFWDDETRNDAVTAGTWVAGRPVDYPRVIGFGPLPSWYSRQTSLSKAAADFLRGQEDLSKLMFFVTQHKAEEWKETIEPKHESDVLNTHMTDLPPGIVPQGAIAITCGIDAQKYGFWFVVRAWGEDLTSWLIQYGYLSAWDDVEALLYRTRYQVKGSSETRGIWRAVIDTGGGVTEDSEWTRTEEIYQWLRKQQPGLVYGTKGASQRQQSRIRVSVIDRFPRSNKPIPGGLELRLVDTAQFKEIIHWRLSRGEDESQRFFLHNETGIDYARQLLAEEKRRTRRGKIEWRRIRKDNHLLDCEVYAAACADPEWLPSLQMLASYMKKQNEAKAMNRDSKLNLDQQAERMTTERVKCSIYKFKRPSWLERR